MRETSFYLDTNVIIAIVEAQSFGNDALQDFWQRGTSRDPSPFHTSDLSLAELLVAPYKRNDRALVTDYLRLFSESRLINVHAITRPILDIAAVIRSQRRMKLPDAIQIATASAAGCTHFLTFDTGFSQLEAKQHPFFEDVTLSPVEIVHPSPTSLSELTQALS